MKGLHFIKILLLLSVLLLRPQKLLALEPYYCIDKGAVLNYERVNVVSGKLKWRHTLSIDDVYNSKDEEIVKCTSTFSRQDGSKMFGGPIDYEAYVRKNGGVELSPAEVMASALRNFIPKELIESGDEMTELPYEMSVGMALPDISTYLSIAGLKYVIKFIDRRVLRKETLKTSAGTFSCVVVTEKKLEKGLGRSAVTTALTWYASGIGMVRHDTYDQNLKIMTSEVLKSFSK